jgi:hypothetical protein
VIETSANLGYPYEFFTALLSRLEIKPPTLLVHQVSLVVKQHPLAA